MSGITTITIDDGQATPVAVAFEPVRTSPIAVYKNSGTIAAGNKLIELEVLEPTQSVKTTRVKLRFALPLEVLDSDTGLTSVVDVNRVNIGFTFAPSSEISDRKDAQAFVKNAMSNPAVIEAIENAIAPW